VPVAAPVAEDGRTLGYVVQWRYVANDPSQRQAIQRLIGPESGFIIGTPGDGAWTDLAGVVPAPPVDLTRFRRAGRFERAGLGTRLALSTAVPHTPWVVLVELSEHHVLAPAERFLGQIVTIAALVWLAGVLGVWLVMRRITGRLLRLTTAAESISAPPGSAPRGASPPPSPPGDELARLGSAFSSMAARVEESHRQLESTVEELRTARDQFAHTQRMEAVGRLAGGVAHDFNNLLTVILGGVEMALHDPASVSRADLLDIRHASERAAALTAQLLSFSRRQVVAPMLLDLNVIVLDLEKMLARLIGENIRVVTRPSAEPAPVNADRGQLEQVIVNLAVNARDAMPAGGVIIIEVDTTTLSDEYTRSRADVRAGDYVLLTVSDTGTGMTDEVKAHLFEPFFTTKDRGKGTGLGLATCYGIIKQCGGHVAAYSELGVGTTMRVYLPVHHDELALAAEPEAEAAGGSETILLVEDESGVRQVAARMLGAQGYRVIEAASAEEALEILAASGDTIHLMLTDVMLPGLGGRELAERVAGMRAGIKVIFASGYTDDVVLQHQLVARHGAFVQKPFTPRSLGRKVREVLDAG
jgi:signal transduction histidine kinase/CheY-like chemotaxis protein